MSESKEIYLNVLYNNYLGYITQIEDKPHFTDGYLVEDWKISIPVPISKVCRLVIIDTDCYFNGFYNENLEHIINLHDYPTYEEANARRKLLKHLVREDDYSWTPHEVDREAYLAYIIINHESNILKHGVL